MSVVEKRNFLIILKATHYSINRCLAEAMYKFVFSSACLIRAYIAMASLFFSSLVTINSYHIIASIVDARYIEFRSLLWKGWHLFLAKTSVVSLRLNSIEFSMAPEIDLSDPLFIGASDVSRATLIPMKLVGLENYEMWSRSIRISLLGKRKYGFVTSV